jgi:hypothetical protein
MPPFSGTETEAADLSTYLQTLKSAQAELASAPAAEITPPVAANR